MAAYRAPDPSREKAIHYTLYVKCRAAERNANPAAASIDSRSVKSAADDQWLGSVNVGARIARCHDLLRSWSTRPGAGASNIVAEGRRGFPPMIAWVAARRPFTSSPWSCLSSSSFARRCTFGSCPFIGRPMTPGGHPHAPPLVAGKVKTREQSLVYTLVYSCGLAVAGDSGFCRANLWYRGDCRRRRDDPSDLAAAERRRRRRANRSACLRSLLVYLYSPVAAYLVRKELTAHFWLS